MCCPWQSELTCSTNSTRHLQLEQLAFAAATAIACVASLWHSCASLLRNSCPPAAPLRCAAAGCGKKADGCPFVAYRDAPAWDLVDCKDVSQCPPFDPLTSSTSNTVPARGLDGKLAACLTLPADNSCPNSVALNLEYPLEVTSAIKPQGCGTATSTCIFDSTSTTTRTVECRRVRCCCCCCWWHAHKFGCMSSLYSAFCMYGRTVVLGRNQPHNPCMHSADRLFLLFKSSN
jgi:hypothetical protein